MKNPLFSRKGSDQHLNKKVQTDTLLSSLNGDETRATYNIRKLMCKVKNVKKTLPTEGVKGNLVKIPHIEGTALRDS